MVRGVKAWDARQVFWITGLSASGKTTLANLLVNDLRLSGQVVALLDGDVIRSVLGETNSYTKEERLSLALTYSRLAKMLSDQGIIVVIATIALFHEIHSWNRKNITKYCEIFLDVPLSELRKRDPKGIYKKFYNGEVKNVAGLDFQVDFPLNPDLLISFDQNLSEKEVYDFLKHRLSQLGIIG